MGSRLNRMKTHTWKRPLTRNVRTSHWAHQGTPGRRHTWWLRGRCWQSPPHPATRNSSVLPVGMLRIFVSCLAFIFLPHMMKDPQRIKLWEAHIVVQTIYFKIAKYSWYLHTCTSLGRQFCHLDGMPFTPHVNDQDRYKDPHLSHNAFPF